VLKTLDQLGLTENTLVIVSSDNGPVLNDGYLDRAVELVGDHRPAGVLRGGKSSAFEGGTRVPFIVRFPAQIKPGVSNALIGLIDFPATFAALTNQTVQPLEIPDSENVLPALLGKTQNGRDSLVLSGASMSFRHGNWKMIVPSKGAAVSVNTNTETGNNPQPQVYRLDHDLSEQNNLAETEPETWNRLRTLLNEIREKHRTKNVTEQ
jgi:arylsulfatase A-like enzyme